MQVKFACFQHIIQHSSCAPGNVTFRYNWRLYCAFCTIVLTDCHNGHTQLVDIYLYIRNHITPMCATCVLARSLSCCFPSVYNCGGAHVCHPTAGHSTAAQYQSGCIRLISKFHSLTYTTIVAHTDVHKHFQQILIHPINLTIQHG